MLFQMPGIWTMFQSLSIAENWLWVTTPPISTEPADSAPLICRIENSWPLGKTSILNWPAAALLTSSANLVAMIALSWSTPQWKDKRTDLACASASDLGQAARRVTRTAAMRPLRRVRNDAIITLSP